MSYTQFLNTALAASIEAGKAILEIYNTDFDVQKKEDKSPLTEADLRSHNVIKKALNEFDIPVLSEEGKSIDYSDRKNWKELWIVDPLDGTKEFVKRNGEFTVNIALAKNSIPVLGIIYIPVTETLYFAEETIGAFKIKSPQTTDYKELINLADKLPLNQSKDAFTMVGSRSHMSDETTNYMNSLKEKHGEVEIISCGSSIKLCMVAEGRADVYPRFAPTMEWDTAAGHAICRAAECEVIRHDTGEALTYNKENLLNPWFIVNR